MAGTRSAIDAFEPHLNQVANTCLLLEYLAFNDVNLACLARAGASRLQGMFAGLLRAVGDALSRVQLIENHYRRSASGQKNDQDKPRKIYMRCTDILRFLAAVCRDETVQAALTRNFSNLGAFMAIAKRTR
jgi:hypothetical protein